MTFTDDLDAVRVRAGIRRPARFRIKRFPLGASTDPVWPWRVADAERPYVFGRARTHAAALLLIDAIVNGHITVVDDDGEVVAYRPGPADEVFKPADVGPFINLLDGLVRPIAEGWGTLFGIFPPRRGDYALIPDPWPEAGGGCKCWVNPRPLTHYGIVEPGDALEFNPDCPMHGHA